MDSHQIREENALLRARISQSEEKMRMLADALETRNIQMKEFVDMYNQLQEQFRLAQEAADANGSLVAERDEVISQYAELISQLKNKILEISKRSSQDAENLRGGLTNERLHFIETLNRLSQAKAPAEEAFREMEELLEKKSCEISRLQKNYDELSSNFNAINEANKNTSDTLQRLLREKADLEQDNQYLKNQLADAKSGRQELAQIEALKREIDELNQKIHNYQRKCSKFNKYRDQCLEQVQQKEQTIEDLQATINGLVDEVQTQKSRVKEQADKNDVLREKCSRAMQNEKNQYNRANQMEEKCKNLEEQLRLSNDQLKKVNEDQTKSASERLKLIRHQGLHEEKTKSLKAKLKCEIEKRLSAEEAVFANKEQVVNLKKEIALLRDELFDAKTSDVEPLVQLLRELRLESISIESEFKKLIESVPAAKALTIADIPPGICESAAAVLARVFIEHSTIEIENRELRDINSRLARIASTYHRIVDVIQKYPILTTDDIGKNEPYGNWVLPVDVEHLQRTVIKLHEILSRKK